jgi:hypothetical protein
MGRRKAKVSGGDISDTVRVLSYDASQDDLNDERDQRLELNGGSSVRRFLHDFTAVKSLHFTCLCRTLETPSTKMHCLGLLFSCVLTVLWTTYRR